ncbi:hypothetical protein ACIBCN_01465 [Nocardia sp. NPDC051052]|uniref:hypothetical protein n=1 Tax=Nocardia sp. NPDC051052 TaxID=3364322 RepID=UPI0037881168
MTAAQENTPAQAGALPDVAFKMGANGPSSAEPAKTPDSAVPEADPAATEPTLEDRAADLAYRVAQELAVAGPEGWQRFTAVFVLTVLGGVHTVIYYDDADQAASIEPSDEIMELVRRQREVSAPLGDGPWWRMTIQFEVSGQAEFDYDYGAEPFPDEHLLVPEAYLADLQAFPRQRLPVWLAAYLAHDNRQWRTPREAAAQTRADWAAGVVAMRSVDDFPELSVLWARWAAIAAAFVAVGSEWGPRIQPAVGVFEGSSRGGATLYVLPGGRATLSGGVWNAPELEVAYHNGTELPDLYAGAPDWVANQILNPRAARGLMSFCYWWEDGNWYRGDSPSADRLSAAVPGIWTDETVIDVVCGVLSDQPSAELRTAAATLVAAAEAGVVTRDTLTALFDDPDDDVDGALYQLSLAGLVTKVPEERQTSRSARSDKILDRK